MVVNIFNSRTWEVEVNRLTVQVQPELHSGLNHTRKQPTPEKQKERKKDRKKKERKEKKIILLHIHILINL